MLSIMKVQMNRCWFCVDLLLCTKNSKTGTISGMSDNGVELLFWFCVSTTIIDICAKFHVYISISIVVTIFFRFSYIFLFSNKHFLSLPHFLEKLSLAKWLSLLQTTNLSKNIDKKVRPFASNWWRFEKWRFFSDWANYTLNNEFQVILCSPKLLISLSNIVLWR